ncbi:DNA topoisomerase IB [Sphingomonas sp.]|uniref:DNA topoisomerase IB n=1 Tax=Sphingomonas sp. TaxID=28214 RepID=UPI000DB55095|nr:DNA topoisomerase IB [Sphingomonas sp.]PZU10923.1 MAG: DNA topoisomerase [Sphingomonas sp.]
MPEPERSAILCFVDDALPGIRRRRAGKGWAYFDAGGKRIANRAEIDRLNAIALPPAYRDAWFCPSPHGHIQATGIDDRGRKQYRYHAAFRARQDARKYERCADFGRALPLLRARVAEDLASRRLDRDTVVAAVVRLLDLGHIRVGNEAYARENRSFGATTLRNRHARVAGAKLRLEYKGKSGKTQRLTIEDRRLATIVRRTQDLPGQRLFEYVGEDGALHPVGSADVNDYIREAMGGDFTAKHFRTWGASLLAFEHILLAARSGHLSLKPMLEEVASALGNTPAISRKSYVHPALIELCRQGNGDGVCALKLPRATKYMKGAERALIGFLDEVVAAAKTQAEAA